MADRPVMIEDHEVPLQPDDLEALQAETDDSHAPAARVEIVGIDGPVRTQDLPRKAASSRTRSGITTTPVRVLAADHRRAIARVMSVGANMLIAFSAASAQDPSTMSLWPQNVSYTLTADTELWVAAATGTTTISVSCEFWATGA